ncbi:CPBP family intramembrane glutamic endopeptidase [Aureispira anguillae]|uniref:CPBP family glutamic-type intramembrane protease n=1 Tax=Aureispira anguillae TaxID=2864201 RepID=A0A915YLD9_9BACT|nr:CPBP family intramembrane glutamic endopeptidase [Aureispira anguillae]BDS15359.1 CPBP family glutamic-type intramembrane protease [Aureispira anguillae]
MTLKNRFVFPLLVYLIMYAFTVPLVLTLKPYITPDQFSIVHKSLVITAFLFLISRYIKNKEQFFQFSKPNRSTILLFSILGMLFATNNYFLSNYSINYSYLDLENTILGWFILAITISSTAEELLYRGFIQSYTNQGSPVDGRLLSQGNLYATFFFFMAHVGFYTIMDPIFATTSLLLVVVFSLSVGYIRDKTSSLFWPILIHITCNYIHIAFHWKHFLNGGVV